MLYITVGKGQITIYISYVSVAKGSLLTFVEILLSLYYTIIRCGDLDWLSKPGGNKYERKSMNSVHRHEVERQRQSS